MIDLPQAFGLMRSLAIYHGQPWRQRRLKRFYAGLIDKGDLCFDIGAHVGNRSGAMLAAGGRVVALEPQPVFLAFLRRFMNSKGLTIVGSAAGAEPGELTLRISRCHPTVTTLSPEWIGKVGSTHGFTDVEWDREARVRVTTLDLLIAEHGLPRFCKIDVEGMEAEILKGLSRPIPLIAFEYIPAALEIALACIDRLEEFGGYRYNAVEGERHGFTFGDWLDGPAMRAAIRQAASNGMSGDLYARLSA